MIIDGMKRLSAEVQRLAKKDKNAAISVTKKMASDYFAEYEEKSHERAMATMREILKCRNKDIEP